jgi:hypothetical protein
MRMVRCSRVGAAAIIRVTSSGLNTMGNLPGNLGENQIVIGDIPPLQDLLVKKTQGRHPPLDRARRELPLPKQVKLEPSYLVTA